MQADPSAVPGPEGHLKEERAASSNISNKGCQLRRENGALGPISFLLPGEDLTSPTLTSSTTLLTLSPELSWRGSVPLPLCFLF